MNRMCGECGKPNNRAESAKWCSKKCSKRVEHRLRRERLNALKPPRPPRPPREPKLPAVNLGDCRLCGASLLGLNPARKYCSDEHARRAHYEYEKRHRSEYVIAHYAVTYCVKKGWLKPSPTCDHCGSTVGRSTGRMSAHHEDYSRPLEVIWLCNPCHVRHHPGARTDYPTPTKKATKNAMLRLKST